MSGAMNFDTVRLEVTGHVATITLNRPARKNAFNRAMAEEFATIWRRLREDDAVHAVVLRAAGERAFCTRVDVKDSDWIAEGESPWASRDPGVWLGPKQNAVWKPVICAVNGMAGRICCGWRPM